MTIDKSKPIDEQIADQLAYQIEENRKKIEHYEYLDSIDGRKTNSTHNASLATAYANKNSYLQKLLNYQLNLIARKPLQS